MTVSPTARQKELLVAQRCCADVFKDDAAHPEGRELLASVEAALAEAERHFSEAVGMSGRKDLPAAERQCNEALAVFPGHAGGQALLQEVQAALQAAEQLYGSVRPRIPAHVPLHHRMMKGTSL